MSKAMLHSLIDLLSDSDTETIYKVLIKFIPEDEPLPDEVTAFQTALKDLQNNNVSDFNKIDWGEI